MAEEMKCKTTSFQVQRFSRCNTWQVYVCPDLWKEKIAARKVTFSAPCRMYGCHLAFPDCFSNFELLAQAQAQHSPIRMISRFFQPQRQPSGNVTEIQDSRAPSPPRYCLPREDLHLHTWNQTTFPACAWVSLKGASISRECDEVHRIELGGQMPTPTLRLRILIGFTKLIESQVRIDFKSSVFLRTA